MAGSGIFGRLGLQDDISQPAEILVTVAARLHLGFLDLNGRLGRRFGGIGLAIDQLNTGIVIRRAEHSDVSGPESRRVQGYLHIMERLLGHDAAHAVKVLQTVPAHAGLGSGTQLALAVASGVRRLHNLPLDIEEDALRLGRGARSGIGIGLFHRGGLVVDGGHGRQTKVAPIISHLSFPEHWRILVVLDPNRSGVHGHDEASAFATLAPMAELDAAQICHLVLMKALPGLAEQDIVSFGVAIKELQVRLGHHFARAQGGTGFTSSAVAAVLAVLDDAGAHGIGQSSWGPTGFAFVSSAGEAERLAKLARAHPAAKGLDIKICSGLNRGAEIVAISSKAESSGS
jgi:beta-ribofuranosylaminobenzene 5'-phosphate synthase